MLKNINDWQIYKKNSIMKINSQFKLLEKQFELNLEKQKECIVLKVGIKLTIYKRIALVTF